MVTLPLLNQFSGKKVFVTGHTGFKGSWLCYWLATLGAVVKGYALPPETSPNLYDQINKKKEIESVFGDINDFTLLQNEMQTFEPDFVFHLAAQPLVRRSYSNPLNTFTTNVIGTANVLEVVRHLNCPCVCICITTDKVYHNNEWIYPYRETDRLGGHDPYSASKACAELLISSYCNSFLNIEEQKSHHKSIATARAGNVIGGGDWSEDRLFPDIVKALSKGEEIVIRNPSAVRPWQHVMEPLFGYMKLALEVSNDPATFSGAWNFGPHNHDSLAVNQLADMAISAWGKGKLTIKEDRSAPHEAHYLRLDISKAIGELGWLPRMKVNDAVQRTIQWYKAFYDGAKATDLIDEDLKYYESLHN